MSALYREQQREPKPPVLPSVTIAGPEPASPNLVMPELTLSCRATSTLKEGSRESMSPPCCRLQPSPYSTPPVLTTPRPAAPCRTASALQREQQRGANSPVLPSAVIAVPRRASPMLAPPDPAPPDPVLLGLTPKDAQHDQATSASIRFRVSVTGTTSASKRPCLGLQSPKPTSLPASLAISATSPRFSTSGSY